MPPFTDRAHRDQKVHHDGSAARVAIVTGAASGIGRSLASDLVDRGWKVASFDRLESPECSNFMIDVADPDAVNQAVADVERTLGPVAAIVTAAGHYHPASVSDITREQWDSMLRVHLGSLMTLSRAALPAMMSRSSGSIVAVTSDLGVGGGAEEAHYAAAKGAVIGFIRSLALETAASGVRVNAVAPGPTDTPMIGTDSAWRDPAYLRSIPLGRLVSPEAVARSIRFLIEEGTYVHGEVLSPNAGTVI